MSKQMISLSVPTINGNEWEYIKECLDTEWVSSSGKYVNKFEEEIKKFTGAKHAIACVNGTAALQISLKLAGVQTGDEVIVPTITFIAPVNVVKYLGAATVFLDCDDYYNLDVKKLEKFLAEETIQKDGYTFNKTSGRKISAILPVHIFGNALNLDVLMSLSEKYNIKLVEDATEALGTCYTSGNYKGKHAGTIGLFGCLSFNGNKLITTGGGGMILTNDDELAAKAKYFTTQAKNDELYYIHDEIGYNFRLTNLQAALGCAQLERVEAYLATKKKNYEKYSCEINKIEGLSIAAAPENASNNYWMYALRIDTNKFKLNRDELLKYLKENMIETRPLWYPNHLQKPYLSSQNYEISKAMKLWDNTLNIPCSVGIKDEDVDRVIEALKNV